MGIMALAHAARRRPRAFPRSIDETVPIHGGRGRRRHAGRCGGGAGAERAAAEHAAPGRREPGADVPGPARLAARPDRALSGPAAGPGADGLDLSARGRAGGALRQGQSRSPRSRAGRRAEGHAVGSERAFARVVSAGSRHDERQARLDAAAGRRVPRRRGGGDADGAGPARAGAAGRQPAKHGTAAGDLSGPDDHHPARAAAVPVRSRVQPDRDLRSLVGARLSALVLVPAADLGLWAASAELGLLFGFLLGNGLGNQPQQLGLGAAQLARQQHQHQYQQHNNVWVNRPGYRDRVPNNGNWSHNVDNRRGVAYRDSATSDRYRPNNNAGVQSRENYRGRDNATRPAPGRGGPPGNAGSGNNLARPSPGTGRIVPTLRAAAACRGRHRRPRGKRGPEDRERAATGVSTGIATAGPARRQSRRAEPCVRAASRRRKVRRARRPAPIARRPMPAVEVAGAAKAVVAARWRRRSAAVADRDEVADGTRTQHDETHHDATSSIARGWWRWCLPRWRARSRRRRTLRLPQAPARPTSKARTRRRRRPRRRSPTRCARRAQADLARAGSGCQQVRALGRSGAGRGGARSLRCRVRQVGQVRARRATRRRRCWSARATFRFPIRW